MPPPRFADRFVIELAAFQAAIHGPRKTAQAAAPLLLHRLMFAHFLDRAGFLDGVAAKLIGRPDFYRQVLLPLFQVELPRFLGVHLFGPRPSLAEVAIADEAFARLFAFFADYSWKLTGSDEANENGQTAVTPKILGTLFEKFANRKATGTYYTPDDVTAYIARTTIVPGVLDRVRTECPAAFEPGGAAWRRLQAAPDRYIFAAVRARTPLPTETAPEHAARRLYYRRLRNRLQAGRIGTANDLVTLNLDMRQLALDLAADTRLSAAFSRALECHTVLDPTCGSGAFLFAALRVLEEMWSGCGVTPSFARRERILLKNLHGVDLNEEAVELCRLRLLLELLAVARPDRQQRLPDLAGTIRVGDTLAGFDWPASFPQALQHDGFATVIGNPPYLPARRLRGAAVANFATAACTDVYAWVLERSAALVRPGGRCGMIVPLSLAFAEAFAACRRLLLAQYGDNWFAHFARIPAALFAGDVRVRNTIHLGHKSGQSASPHTTRLHRWFEAARPFLFETLTYVPFRPEPWDQRLPKLGSSRLLTALQHCLTASSARLGDCLAARPTPYPLFFKKTAYNWLTFCPQQPPCFTADGHEIPHTQFDAIFFATPRIRDVALLFLNGKWAFAFWCAAGDDFHVTRWTFAGFPIDLNRLPAPAVRRLLPLARQLERGLHAATAFKQNAGKRVGTYNLGRCRTLTDRSDAIFADCLGLKALWPEVELLYAQLVKTDWGQEPAVRNPQAAAYNGR